MIEEIFPHSREIVFDVNGDNVVFKSTFINNSNTVAFGDIVEIKDSIPDVDAELMRKVMEIFITAGFSRIQIRYLFVPKTESKMMLIHGKNPAGSTKAAVIAPFEE